MKKIYYLIAFVALAFTACQKEPALQSSVPLQSKQALTITLQASDYAKLSSGYPKTTLTFDDLADANKYIPQILTSEYTTAGDGSTAKVTYTISSLYFKVADSLLSDVAYTLTNADYLLLTGNKYTDFSTSQMLQWMNEDTSKYHNSVNGQIALVTFTPYPSTLTPPPPYTYVKVNGMWRQGYTIQPAQYTQAGEGKYDQFSSSVTEASLVNEFNFFLKNDFTIMDTIKKGDLEFVSFGWYNSGDFQRVKPLQFDGNNFVPPYNAVGAGVATFVKANSTWKPEPVVAYALTTADITLLGNGTYPGSANLKQYGDFDSDWTTAIMNTAIIQCLQVDITSPQQNTLYQVSFKSYNSPAPNPSSFIWDGSKWVAQQ